MFEDRDSAAARPLWLVAEGDLEAWLATQDEATRAWLAALRFRAERHQVTCLARGRRRGRAARCSGSARWRSLADARALAPRAAPSIGCPAGLAHRDPAAGASGDGGRARLGARQLSLRALSQQAARRRARRRSVPPQLADMALRAAHGRRARDGARPHQHAGRRPVARAARRGSAGAGGAQRRRRPLHRRRRAARGLSGDPRGGAGRGVGAAAGRFHAGATRRRPR